MQEIEILFSTLRARLLEEKPETDTRKQMLDVTLRSLGETITAFKTYDNLTHSDPAIAEMARSFAAEFAAEYRVA